MAEAFQRDVTDVRERLLAAVLRVWKKRTSTHLFRDALGLGPKRSPSFLRAHAKPPGATIRTMSKFKAVVEYDGTQYHGWQLQKDLPTVQGGIESALERVLGEPTRVHGAGRTDAGVHAWGQVAHFAATWAHSTEDLRRACNALLPQDIVMRTLEPAADDFHARHSARSKVYVYQILNAPLRSPLNRLYAYHVPHALDRARLEDAAAHLIGTHDFAAFGSPTDGTPSTVREVLDARWEAGEDGMLRFAIRATGFLRYMVRAIVGTLIPVGTGKIDPLELRDILLSRNRSRSGPTAPPHGLFLESVDYGGESLGV